MKHLILLLALFATLSSCRHGRNFSHDEKNSVYYWKTVFAPDSSDFAFTLIPQHYNLTLFISS